MPIAAFTMALLLGSYSISSIHAARREARYSSARATPREDGDPVHGNAGTGTGTVSGVSSAEWIARALEEESRDRERERGGEEKIGRGVRGSGGGR
jgi:hypothetical protein